MTSSPFLTKQQLAERHHLSPRSVERRMRDGSGPPYVRLGQRALWLIADIEAWETAARYANREAELQAQKT